MTWLILCALVRERRTCKSGVHPVLSISASCQVYDDVSMYAIVVFTVAEVRDHHKSYRGGFFQLGQAVGAHAAVSVMHKPTK
jgi:hypothetical protein